MKWYFVWNGTSRLPAPAYPALKTVVPMILESHHRTTKIWEFLLIKTRCYWKILNSIFSKFIMQNYLKFQ